MNKILYALAAAAAAFTVQSASAQTVKVTPLGSHDGEFCRNDRAMVFEDPDGTRILYDAGRTVRGGADPRLGNINAVLLSHVHPDHLGDAHPSGDAVGACANPDISVKVLPQSNTVAVTVAKKAQLLVGAEMASFFAPKVKAAGGDPASVLLLRYGASRKVGGVEVISVPAAHSNGVPPEFLDEMYSKALAANGLTAYVGEAGGYVLRFSNGLTAYLSGDTGMIAEQDVVIGRYYKPQLAVMNIGGIFTTGPREAAHVVDEMVKSKTVIASHANEEATKGGQAVGNNIKAFQAASKAKVVVPISGKTFEFDKDGTCTKGC
jgi:L-ascorbate metabolism protein UlaG (beta-lactamase superfamily)